jgi:hypothetical protein
MNKPMMVIDIETRGIDADDIMIVWDSMGMMIEVEPGEEHMWWTTLKGENIRIDKMDTDHLKNTIAMLKRNGRYKLKRTAPVYRNMQEEYFKRVSPAGGVLFGKQSSEK